jgi:hypothetical protein
MTPHAEYCATILPHQGRQHHDYIENMIRIIIAFVPFLFGVIALHILSCFTVFGLD